MTDIPRYPILVNRLKTLLASIPENCILVFNKLGNLAIYTHEGKYAGYLDMKNNSIEWE